MTGADDGSVVAGDGTAPAPVPFKEPRRIGVAGSRMERCMSPQTLVGRIETLEGRVTALEELPARIDDLTSQVLRLREEMRGEFSAVRTEMRELNDETKRHMLVLHEDVIARLTLIQESANGKKRPGTKRSR